MGRIQEHRELEVYQIAFAAAIEIFELTKRFPLEERYSLTDQIRRSLRAVCANLAEAWRRRRSEAVFLAKSNDCESAAAETQIWLEFAVRCSYLDAKTEQTLNCTYNKLIGGLVLMIQNPTPWILKRSS